MKKSIVIIVLAIALIVAHLPTPTNVHPILETDVEEFIASAESYGIDTSVIRDSLDHITPFPISEYMYGVYTPFNRQISINMRNCNNPIILRAVMYHELGHVFGIDHSSGGIMESGLSPLQITLRFGSPTNWVLYKSALFAEIKKLQDKK